MSCPPFLFDWQSRIASSDGPREYSTRLVLLALAVLMARQGGGRIRVTSAEVAEATGLSVRWATVVLKKAADSGWVRREHPVGQGSAWQAYEYSPTYPHSDLPEQVSCGTAWTVPVAV